MGNYLKAWRVQLQQEMQDRERREWLDTDEGKRSYYLLKRTKDRPAFHSKEREREFMSVRLQQLPFIWGFLTDAERDVVMANLRSQFNHGLFGKEEVEFIQKHFDVFFHNKAVIREEK